ncbi:Phenolic glucoside malonyltransferase 2 [Apostasia shenzhenica]|uniref:Phenolic glucoside malonyltransferase 2 n=1 Tax=Apostasia shenzhenica TaxID=1088818 RepID=A0A2I0ALR8_9ASPA|nr:Phenolic glucoside malonyltransferase 2 [Apostasia shenzhenica]
MKPSASAVTLLEQSRISPLPPAAGDYRPSLPLSFFDVLWLNYSAVERLFFFPFPHPTSHFLEFHLPCLKSALAVALAAFYPLAGTVRRSSSDRFEISCSASDAVPLTICDYVSATDYHEISGNQPRELSKLLQLVPKLPLRRGAQPLLATQITLFSGHGLCLALAVHHSACDGFSSMQFVKSWAAAFRQNTAAAPPQPVMDRSVIPDPRHLYDQNEKAVLDASAEEMIVTSGLAGASVFAATFTLSAAKIAGLNQRVQLAAAEQRRPSPRCSVFSVSCAHAWICLLKTRARESPDREAHFAFAVDWRRRIRPPIPANYFGNCLSGCFVKCDAGELLGEDGLFTAATAIAKAIDGIGDDVHANMDGIVGRLASVAPFQPLSLAGSPKLGVYEVDFGWGKARKVEVTSIRETGAMAVAESRDGEGGIEFGIVLPDKEMEAFAGFLAAGMG